MPVNFIAVVEKAAVRGAETTAVRGAEATAVRGAETAQDDPSQGLQKGGLEGQGLIRLEMRGGGRECD